MWAEITIENRSISFSYQVDMVAEANKKDFIKNRMSWPPILELLSEGAKVKKGDRVILFNGEELKQEINLKSQQLKIADLVLKKKILDLERESQSIRDNIELKEAEVKVIRARLRRLKSYPLQSDIDLAKGSLKVTQLQFQEKKDEVARAEQRLDKGLISASAFADMKADLEILKLRLNSAEKILDFVSSPMSSLSIQLVQLRMERLEVELEKFRDELSNQDEVAKLETQSAQRQRNRDNKRLKEKKEEIDHIELFAPRDGFIQYESSFSNSLRRGSKPRKDSSIMSMPHLDSIIFNGNLPGHLGSQFKEGDRVEILIPHLRSTPFSGNISALSPSPKDLMDQSSSWSDQGKKSGIKFFPFTVTPDEKIPSLKPGLNARVVLYSSEPVEGPMVPARYVEQKGEKFYVALEGQMTPISGRFQGPWFIVDDKSLTGKRVTLRGKWKDFRRPTSSDSQNYSLTGELKPKKAVDIRVPIFRGWWSRELETQWVVDEGSHVEAGDHLLTLDSNRGRESFKDLEDRTERTRLEMESNEKETRLRSKKGAFELRMKDLDLQIAKVRLDELLEPKEGSDLIRARESAAVASLEVQGAKRHLSRIEAHPEWNSERTLAEAKRDLRVKKLGLEQALIRLEKARQTITEVEIAEAKSNVAKARFRLTQHQGRLKQQERNANRSQKHRKRRYERNIEELGQMKEDFERFKIHASGNGIVQYQNVWGDGKMIPIKEGVRVWANTKVLRLIDNDEVYIETDVSERHTHRVKVGMEVSIDIPAMDAYGLKGRLTQIDEVYKPPRLPDTESKGLYGSQESQGESAFRVRIEVEEEGMTFKSGAIAKVTFPFPRES